MGQVNVLVLNTVYLLHVVIVDHDEEYNSVILSIIEMAQKQGGSHCQLSSYFV